MSDEKEKKAERVKVKILIDNHTHAGALCEKDAIIEVTKNQAERLVKNKIAESAK